MLCGHCHGHGYVEAVRRLYQGCTCLTTGHCMAVYGCVRLSSGLVLAVNESPVKPGEFQNILSNSGVVMMAYCLWYLEVLTPILGDLEHT